MPAWTSPPRSPERALLTTRARVGVILIAFALTRFAAPAGAVMDINDRGPVLDAGAFAMRVTNIGVLGNAFFDVGLSFDPSFEYPKGSGKELLKHADLWVGATNAQGVHRVSGGPMLEWRPTLDPNDRVLKISGALPGTQRGVDDDGDGKVDEEVLNGRDDDGDGEIDEDLGVPGQQTLAADYVDDRPEAVNYGYPNGEVHSPLALSVHQEAYGWSLPGYDGIAGIQFTITNHGDQVLHDLYVGMLCDLDTRTRTDQTGNLNDLAATRTVSRTFPEGAQRITIGGNDLSPFGGPWPGSCFLTATRTAEVVTDGLPNSGMPVIAVLPLAHTIDPLALLQPQAARDAARAPGVESFRLSTFTAQFPPGQGGPPVLDEDRYQAMAGAFPTANPSLPGDQEVLVSCGPFQSLAPGQSIEFALAFVAAASIDSLPRALSNALFLHHGTKLNLLPDSLSSRTEWNSGATGTTGHEVCIEPPSGVTFTMDPNCPDKILAFYVGVVPDQSSTYAHGHCVWTDADCNPCTGVGGNETIVRWLNPGTVPPAPNYHVAAGDHEVTVQWDNRSEILLNAGIAGAGGYSFNGYRIYKLSNWKRESLLPPPDKWEQVAAFGIDTLDGARALATVRDTLLDYDLVEYGQKHYPIGRYQFVDHNVLDGFDYLYLITTLAQRRITVGAGTRVEFIESPLTAAIDSIVVPHEAARSAAGGVWVVPNPFRARAPWDRPPVPGDPFGKHIDFFGLPRTKSTIKIWTVAGDFVAQVDHDGSGGDGEASWNLISRNGQDIESGIYLFTVDSPVGHQTGRFVVIR